jgi:hypothetical protein
MPPRLARALLALTAVAFVGTLAWLGPRWLEPVPDFGEIIGAISARKFGEANRLIERYVRMREPSSLSAILYTFPPDTPEPPAANLGILVPQGRILSEFLPVVVEDGRPGAEKRTYRARLEIEGKIPRDVGPGEAGNLTISMPTIVNDSLGPENAAGRVTVADSDGGTASAAFEIIGARLQRELGLRQQVISRIAGGNFAVNRYLRAMCFAREGCYSSALLQLDALLREAPGDPDLRAARAHCAERLRRFSLTGKS